jgi:hypothetical protein
MTGEMNHDDMMEFAEANGMFKLVTRIKRATGKSAEVQPFDMYQGAYVLVDNNVKIWVSDLGPDFWFVEYRTKEHAGYTVGDKKLMFVLKKVLRRDFKGIEQFLQEYT